MRIVVENRYSGDRTNVLLSEDETTDDFLTRFPHLDLVKEV
jgi:hypothetical protein